MIKTEIRTYKRTESFAACSGCGAEGPHAVDEHDAHHLAIDEGWEFRTIYPGGEMAIVYTCPECIEKQQVRDDQMDGVQS